MRSERMRRRRGGALAVLALVCTAITLLAHETNVLDRQELSTIDARFSIRGTQTTPGDLAVVLIDPTTFDQLGLQWPFPPPSPRAADRPFASRWRQGDRLRRAVHRAHRAA